MHFLEELQLNKAHPKTLCFTEDELPKPYQGAQIVSDNFFWLNAHG